MAKFNGFSFTYSKIRAYETCPKQHYHQTILKEPGLEPSGDAIDYGNRVHAAIAGALKPKEPKELLPAMRHLQYWVDYVKSLPGERHVETRWGLARDFQQAEFYSDWSWMRFIVDVAVVNGKMGWLIDWKTGKRLEEPLQLWLGAACMFAQFPSLEVVDSMFVWLKEDDGTNSHECISAETIYQKDVGGVWDAVLPRIDTYEKATQMVEFPPRPGRHCRWCRVQACEFFGRGN